MKLFVTHDKMTLNNRPTLDRVHVEATELLNYCRCCRRLQLGLCLERQPHKVAVRLRAALKLNEKRNKLLEVRGHVPQCPIIGDANAQSGLQTPRNQNYGQKTRNQNIRHWTRRI